MIMCYAHPEQWAYGNSHLGPICYSCTYRLAHSEKKGASCECLYCWWWRTGQTHELTRMLEWERRNPAPHPTPWLPDYVELLERRLREPPLVPEQDINPDRCGASAEPAAINQDATRRPSEPVPDEEP